MRPLCCRVTSVNNYRSTPRKTSEERRPQPDISSKFRNSSILQLLIIYIKYNIQNLTAYICHVPLQILTCPAAVIGCENEASLNAHFALPLLRFIFLYLLPCTVSRLRKKRPECCSKVYLFSENTIGRACSTHNGKEGYIQNLRRKPRK